MERIRGIVIKTLTILAGFWLADLAASRIQAGIAADESLEQIMDDMTTMLQHPTDLGFDRTSLLCGLGGACAVGLFHLYRWSMSQRNWRDGEEYGSARWSTSREMAPYTDSDTRQNLQMTGFSNIDRQRHQNPFPNLIHRLHGLPIHSGDIVHSGQGLCGNVVGHRRHNAAGIGLPGGHQVLPQGHSLGKHQCGPAFLFT